MVNEVAVKTHLIVTSIQDEYSIKWVGKIKDVKPLFKNNLPVFIIVSSTGRIELNTVNMKYIEECAKNATCPRGRESFTTDKSYIYIVDEDENEKLLGIVTHNHIKHYAPMYDKVGWK